MPPSSIVTAHPVGMHDPRRHIERSMHMPAEGRNAVRVQNRVQHAQFLFPLGTLDCIHDLHSHHYAALILPATHSLIVDLHAAMAPFLFASGLFDQMSAYVGGAYGPEAGVEHSNLVGHSGHVALPPVGIEQCSQMLYDLWTQPHLLTSNHLSPFTHAAHDVIIRE